MFVWLQQKHNDETLKLHYIYTQILKHKTNPSTTTTESQKTIIIKAPSYMLHRELFGSDQNRIQVTLL